MWIHLLVGLMRLFLFFDLGGAIFEFIGAIILYLGTKHVDYCSMVIYTFLVGMSCYTLFELVGLSI